MGLLAFLTAAVAYGAVMTERAVVALAARTAEATIASVREALERLPERISAQENAIAVGLANSPARSPRDPRVAEVYFSGRSMPVRPDIEQRLSEITRAGPAGGFLLPERNHERWIMAGGPSGRRVAVRMEYSSSAARSAIDRQVAEVAESHGMEVVWFAGPPSHTRAQVRRLLGSWGIRFDPGSQRSAILRAGDRVVVVSTPFFLDHVFVATGRTSELRGPRPPRLLIGAVAAGLAAACWLAGLSWLAAMRRQRDLDTLKADFIASVSHELRTPLTAIRGSAEMLAAGLAPAGKQREYHDAIVSEADRLTRMVEDILAFDRSKRSGLALERQPTGLTDLLRDVVRLMEPLAGRRRITLVLDTPSETVAGIDPDTIRQALTNILDNAINHSPDGGTIRVGLAAGARSAVITVDDQGPGIPPELRERIFDPFFRLPAGPGKAERRAGAGLGLTLARRYVETSGGAICAIDAPGGGTRFRLEVPRA